MQDTTATDEKVLAVLQVAPRSGYAIWRDVQACWPARPLFGRFGGPPVWGYTSVSAVLNSLGRLVERGLAVREAIGAHPTGAPRITWRRA